MHTTDNITTGTDYVAASVDRLQGAQEIAISALLEYVEAIRGLDEVASTDALSGEHDDRLVFLRSQMKDLLYNAIRAHRGWTGERFAKAQDELRVAEAADTGSEVTSSRHQRALNWFKRIGSQYAFHQRAEAVLRHVYEETFGEAYTFPVKTDSRARLSTSTNQESAALKAMFGVPDRSDEDAAEPRLQTDGVETSDEDVVDVAVGS